MNSGSVKATYRVDGKGDVVIKAEQMEWKDVLIMNTGAVVCQKYLEG